MLEVVARSSGGTAGGEQPDLPFRFSEIVDDQFFQDVWTKKASYYPGFKSRLRSIFGWPQLNEVLQNSHKTLVPPFIGLVREGNAITFSDYSEIVNDRKYSPYRQVSSQKLEDLTQAGATLVLNGVERLWSPLHDLRTELRSLTNERVQVNAYYSQRPIAAFVPHYDTHEIFILQVGGSKLWRVGGFSYLYPLVDQVSGGQAQWNGPYEEILLEEGDILYLPRGAWHSAMASLAPSLHLSVGVHCQSRYDLVTWMVKEPVDHEELRINLQSSGQQPDINAMKADILRAVGMKLEEVTDLSRFLAHVAKMQESESIKFQFPTFAPGNM